MDDRELLKQHPFSLVRADEAVLPPPDEDPYPGLTLALFDLWTALMSVVSFSGNRPMFRGVITAVQAFRTIQRSLVSGSGSFATRLANHFL